MSIRTMWNVLEKLERQRAEALATEAGGAILFLPPNGRGDHIAGPRLRLFDPAKRTAAAEAGASETAALEAALLD